MQRRRSWRCIVCELFMFLRSLLTLRRAEEFAARGCRVYATARNASKMEGLFNVEKLELDVLSDDSVKAAVETIKAREGRIDILINNAGVGCTGRSNPSFVLEYKLICRKGALLDLPMGTIDHAFQTNVFSVLRLTQAVVPIMVAQKSKGIVVNVGSVSSLVYVFFIPPSYTR
jgi:1-acylglycerone phosphate reductase